MSDTPKQNTLSIGLIVLIASVALNGLLAGMLLAGKNTSGPPPVQVRAQQQSGAALPSDPRRMLNHLPKQRRQQVLKRALRGIDSGERKKFRSLRHDLEAARRQVFLKAEVEPLDIAAFEKSLVDLGHARNNLTKASDKLIVKILQELTPEERQTALKSLEIRERKRRQRQRRN